MILIFIPPRARALLVVALTCCSLLNTRGQDSKPPDFSQVATAEIRTAADQRVSAQRYGEAVFYLQELFNRLKDSETPAVQAELERILYTLALSYSRTENYAAAITSLESYLKNHKDKNTQRTVGALDMLASAYYLQGNYPKAAELYTELLNNRSTPEDRRRVARFNLLDSYVAAKAWDKTIQVGQVFVKSQQDSELQGRAATALSQAYVQTDQPEKVFQLIPLLEGRATLARYRSDFNLAMIAAGDRLYQSARPEMALLFYQIAAPKRIIERWLDERTKELTKQKELITQQQARIPDAAGQIVAISTELKKLEGLRKEMEATKSYDEELRTRLAQTMFNLGRKWEALWLYESLMDDFPGSEFSEKSGYAAFAIAAELGQRDRAIALGKDYMEQFPEGENHQSLSLQMTQLLVGAKEYKQAIDLSKNILEKNPNHLFADKILFFTAFSLMQDEQMAEAADLFLELKKNYPKSETVESAEYWYAMTMLFRGQYPEALAQFKTFAETYREGALHVDAVFRTGVCEYALEHYEAAGKIFENFLTRYPEAPQVAEAHLLLGEIAGNEGRLDDALEHYKLVSTLTVNQGNINLATMNAGRVLETQEKWDEMISWFTDYLTVYSTEGLYAEAIYRIGNAKKNKGDTEGMLKGYFDAIKRYGNNPQAIGIDLVVRDWPKEYLLFNGKPPEDIIRKELGEAITRGEKTMAMRWMMMLDAIAAETGNPALAEPPAMEVTDAELPLASPAILIWIANKAQKKGNKELATAAYARILSEFEENEWYEAALLSLARMNAEENPGEAIKHYHRLRQIFPGSESAAASLEEEADLLAKQKNYAQAVELLQMILEVKEWRGETWARALYKIGDLLREEGKTEEAFGYYQRVYVLYSHYKTWAAKAYLQSAKCLATLGKREEEIATLKEMIANKNLSDLPEYAEAQQLLTQAAP